MSNGLSDRQTDALPGSGCGSTGSRQLAAGSAQQANQDLDPSRLLRGVPFMRLVPRMSTIDGPVWSLAVVPGPDPCSGQQQRQQQQQTLARSPFVWTGLRLGCEACLYGFLCWMAFCMRFVFFWCCSIPFCSVKPRQRPVPSEDPPHAILILQDSCQESLSCLCTWRRRLPPARMS